jgi:DNA-binding transcriptional LysR family regulator
MLSAPLNFNRLRLFLAVADEGSVTQAAATLGISQPAVTRAVHALERDMEVPLVEHVGRGIRLTDPGRALAGYARRIFALAGEAERSMAQLRGLEQGSLAVGASTTIGIYLLPELFGLFHARYPGIELFLDIGNTQQIVERLDSHALDIALVEGPVDILQHDLTALPYRDDKLVLVTCPDHPLARVGSTTIHDLHSLTWILREPGSGTRNVVDQALADVGVRISPALELGSTEAIKRAVAVGLGVSIIPLRTIEQELALTRLTVVPIDGLTITRQLTILQRAGAIPIPVTTTFLEMLHESE